jgi:hypothetical protein
MTIIKIPDADLAEADRLEAKAMQTDDPDEAAGLRLCVDSLRTPPNFPVLDHPRTECNDEFGRVVLEEFGVITPYTPEDDGWKAMPVRLVYDCGGGLQIEAGPYTLGRRQLRVLIAAINAWLKSENDSLRLQAERQAAEPTDGTRDGQVYDTPEVDLDAKINKRNQWLSLKARLETHRTD